MYYSNPLFSDYGRILTSVKIAKLPTNVWDNFFQIFSTYAWIMLCSGFIFCGVLVNKLSGNRFSIKNVFNKLWILKFSNKFLKEPSTKPSMKIIDYSFKLFMFLSLTYFLNLMKTELMTQDLSRYIDTLQQLLKSSYKPYMTLDDPVIQYFDEMEEGSIYKKVLKKVQSNSMSSGFANLADFQPSLIDGRIGVIGSETYLELLAGWTSEVYFRSKNFTFWLSEEKFFSLNWAFGYNKRLSKSKRRILDKWFVIIR